MKRTMMLAAVFLIGVIGCTPSPPKPEELGRVVYDPAEVPGIDNPYHPPELDAFPLIKAPPAVGKPSEGDGLPKGDEVKETPEEEKETPDEEETAAPVETP